jgi:hypothetical protein
MALNFSQSPYNDDFDASKNFYRILYRPDRAVQARELTQSQTILQDQITKFGDHIFKQHSLVSGGQVTHNFAVYYLKLNTINSNNLDVVAADFFNKTVTNSTGNVIAKVVKTKEKSVNSDGVVIETPLLILAYLSGDHFNYGDTVYVKNSNVSATVIAQYSTYSPATGLSSVISITEGVFYVNGVFVGVQEQTIILSEYSNTPTARVGLDITESIVESDNDPSLLDPALGASNFQAPGADRYKVALTLVTKPTTIGTDDENFIELIRFENGIITRSVRNTEYSIIDDYFARRTFETNGDFIVDKFKLSTTANTSSNSSFVLKVGPGKAYVRGYIVENQSDLSLNMDKARDYSTELEKTTYLNYGSYLYIDTITGVMDFKNYMPVDFHVVQAANTANTLAYTATKAGSAKIRALEFTNYTNSSNTKSYVYKASLLDIQTNSFQVTANGTVASNSSVIFPSYFPTTNNSLTGVTLQIVSGNNSGDLVTISSYDGASKKAVASRQFIRDVEGNAIVNLIYNVRDFESLYSQANTAYNAKINSSSKVNGVDAGDVSISNTGDEELVYQLGYPYVKPNSLLNTEYYSWISKDNISMSGGVISLSSVMQFIGNDGDLSLSAINDNFIVYVTNAGSSSLKVGEIISFSSFPTRKITLSNSGTLVTFTCSDLTGVICKVFAKVYIIDANDTVVMKGKNVISPNTSEVFISGPEVSSNTYVDLSAGQIYIKKPFFNSNNQSLYISDVRYVMKVVDTLDANNAPTKAMLTSSTYDITRYFVLNNGQKDNYYDHASIKLLKNSPPPQGNILILVNYYDHTAGDGYFCGDSYLSKSATPSDYEYIPYYTSTSGKTYNLRDSIDFRPCRLNANSQFQLKSINTPSVGIPVDGSNFKFDYSYYLGRKDLLVISKDKEISIVRGTSDLNPSFPNEPDGALVVAKLSLDPYTAFIPGDNTSGDVSSILIQYMTHKRWRMQDITTLEDRVSRIEYYTSLNNLEQSAKNLQIADEYGLNRFKNGILTDDFTTYKIADTSNFDFFASIDPIKKRLFPVHEVKNYPLFLKDALGNFGQINPTIEDALSYNIDMEGVNTYTSLKYTTVDAATQFYASGVVNLNPFNFITKEGTCWLNPPMDNWVSTERLPDLLIVNPDTQLYLQTAEFNELSTGNWQTISSSNDTKTDTIGAPGAPDKIQDGGNAHQFPRKYLTSIMLVLQFIELNDVINMIETALDTGKFPPGASYQSYLSSTRSSLENFKLHFISGTLPPSASYNNALLKPNTTVDRALIAGQKFIENFLITFAQTKNDWIYKSESTTTTTTVSETKSKTEVGGYWENLGDNFINNNGYVTDVSLNPYIRGQQIEFTATGLLHNANVNCYFDGVNVSNRVRQTNKLTLIASANSYFRTGEVFGYNVGDDFKPVAKIINAYYQNTDITIITDRYGNTSTTSLINKWGTGAKIYVCDLLWDSDAEIYSNGKTITKNYDLATLQFDTDGNFVSVNNTADIINVEKRSGKVMNLISPTVFEISKSYDTQLDDIRSKSQYDWWNIIGPTFDYTLNRTGAYLSSNNTIHICCNTSIITTNTIIGSIYTAKPEYSDNPENTGNLKTDETGSISGVFFLPPDTFHTGEKVFRIDNRIAENEGTETTFSQATFFATSLNTKVQHLNFAPDISSARNVFTRTETISTSTTVTSITSETESIKIKNDPVCQSFIFYSDEYPNGLFLKSIRVCFRNKPTDHYEPVTLSILGTLNGYPNGETLPHSIVTKTPDQVKISDSPNIYDSSTYTEFEFSIPVYIKPDTMYAYMLKTNSNEYFVYTAKLGDYPLVSSVQPEAGNYGILITPPKISATPYIGELFLSQNSITWGADQNQDMTFGIKRCEFDTSQTAQIQYVIPIGLPQRRFGEETLKYKDNAVQETANTNLYTYITNWDFETHAFNVSTTDLTFEKAPIRYSYRSTLLDGTKDTYESYIIPGKYGTANIDDIILDDGKGERLLISDSSSLLANSSFSLYARLSSSDSKISPILSDVGLTTYAVKYKINNMELSNTNFVIINGGTGYSANPIITINSSGEGAGSGAVVYANVVGGIIKTVDVITGGSGYANTANVTIVDTSVPTSNAQILIIGETSNLGGTGLCKYVTKPVTLAAGFDAGDLRVYYTAYRPLGTNIHVYYKVLNRNDTQTFFDCNWQLMTTISGSTQYAKKRGDLYEYVAAPGVNGTASNKIVYTSSGGSTYSNFYQFAIKIVLTTDDKTIVPYLIDMRTIALPEPI